MSYYRTCPLCGAHLDPGEVCDCRDNKEAPASAVNTDEGKEVEQVTKAVSIYNDTEKQGGLQDGKF